MSPRPFLALRHRDYRRLWLSNLVSLTGSQMQVVAINWHIYLLTAAGRPALALGAVGLTRVIPIILFSLAGGVAADRHDRRRIILLCQSAMALIALALMALTLLRHESIWLIYALSALSAAATAFDNPARQALIPRLVPREELPAAMSMNLAMFNTAMIGGPALSGLLIAGTGAGILPDAAALARGGRRATRAGWRGSTDSTRSVSWASFSPSCSCAPPARSTPPTAPRIPVISTRSRAA